jgi:hypothetical protein
MKQLETLGFEADELSGRLVEATADQLARSAESTAIEDLARFVVPFGVKLAEEVMPNEINAITGTTTSTNTNNPSQGSWDNSRDSDSDR